MRKKFAVALRATANFSLMTLFCFSVIRPRTMPVVYERMDTISHSLNLKYRRIIEEIMLDMLANGSEW